MTAGGILLPQSVLVSPWFLLLATMVAFNTIIYVGLTLAKLIPWPRQFHPSQVREKATQLGLETTPESIMRQIPRAQPAETTDPYDSLRLDVAGRDIPQAFALTGGLVVALSAVSALVFRDRELWVYVAQLALGVSYLVLAVVLGQRAFRARTMTWTWAAMSVLLVLLWVVEGLVTQTQVSMTYAFALLIAFVPATLAWRPAMTAGVIMLVALTAGALSVPGEEDARLLTVAFFCLLLGSVLLRLRLSAIEALANERARAEALAATDVLTGVLTRRGLLSLVPSLAGNGSRTGNPVCVIYTDIRGLEQINDSYGIAYGDEVVRVVADVLRGIVRQGDLVGRWGGDEFLVAGLGKRPDPEIMRERIEGAVRLTGTALGRQPIEVYIGTASGDPTLTTFEELVHEAHEDLLRLRHSV